MRTVDGERVRGRVGVTARRPVTPFRGQVGRAGLLAILITGGNVQDRARPLLWALHVCFPGIRLVWADSGYAGKVVDWATTHPRAGRADRRQTRRADASVVLHRRWCVKRTFSWINRCRRTVPDYETATRTPCRNSAWYGWP
ncbi:transposase [Dactylosporangium sp. NPDC051484]|uniref:transposase n=1 Tax=Dactylosporangium sp. NPDC051484 TaxID=3154942 RepID=UPI00344B0264